MSEVGVSRDSESRRNGPGEESERCGWGPITPAVCQRFRSPKWLLFVLCCASFIQMMAISGFVNVIISTIERRYDLTSAESGMVASSYDISSAILILPVSYFGGLGSKPRYIGIGFLLFGIACTLFAFPHFFSGQYEYGSDNSGLCVTGGAMVDQCNTGAITTLSNYKYMFYACMILMGAGTTPLYTLATAFLEESVPVRSSSLYLAIYYGSSILGPALGFLAGGLLLDLYVDFDTVDMNTVTIDSTSSRFVGAWWVGFVLCGALAVMLTVPLYGFPSQLPNSSQYVAERQKEVYNDKDSPSGGMPRLSLRRILGSLKVLVTNPTYIFLTLATAVDGILLVGISTFIPKFIEIQFGLPSSTAALYVGIVAVPGGAGGTLLAGYIIQKFDLRMKRILQMTLGAIIGSLFFALVLVISCPSIPFAGVNIPYGTVDTKSTAFLGQFVPDACNDTCDCDQADFSPICGRDGLTYYSPCYAGCRTVVKVDSVMHYYNCSCVGSGPTDHEGVLNKCEPDCPYLPLFMVLFLGVIFLTFFSSMPYLTASLRCVPPSERSFALGIQLCATKCFGFIPGPILFGWLIDLSCLVWHDKCGEGGSCFFYDNQMMSNNILAIALVAKATASVFTLIAYLFYVNRHPDKVQGEESSDNEGDKALGLSSSHDTGISGISDSIVVPDLPIKVSITDTDRAIVQDGGTTDYIAMTDANTKTDFSTRTNDRTSPIVKTSSDTMIKPDLITQTENMTTAL